MSPLAYWLIAIGIVVLWIAVRLVMIRDQRKEPTEMDGYDALASERDEAAKARVLLAERMIAQAHYGPIRDGHEV